MHVLLVIPNASEDFLTQNRPLRLAQAGADLALEVCNLPQAPDTLEGCMDEAMAAPHLLMRIEAAKEQGYDAVIVDCATNVALQATRELSGILIVHAGQAALSAALLLGKAVSVIAVNERDAASLRYQIAADGLDKRICSVRAAQVEIQRLGCGESIDAIQAAAYAAWKEDGADVLLLGCTGMAGLLPEIRRVVPIPVVEPSAAAIQMTHTLLALQK